MSFAKAAAWSLNKPLVAVHHLAGHIESIWLEHGPIALPAIILVVSGGHTSLYLVKKEARSKAAFREELSQLEMKALRAQMNPHFIFNALNSIQTFMLKNETDTALAYLSRFAKLIRNVLDHSQLNNISITRETEMLENYLELERLRLDGRFDGEGVQPINPDGGLKSFGHPIGASGLRMMYEMWLQLRGEAGARQIKEPKLGLTHNLGGAPGRCVSFVSIVGV